MECIATLQSNCILMECIATLQSNFIRIECIASYSKVAITVTTLHGFYVHPTTPQFKFNY